MPINAPNYQYPEDIPHVSGDRGNLILAVRKDAVGASADDGDYIPLITDAAGRLHVTVSSALGGLGDPGTLNNGSEITVTGTATQLVVANSSRKMLLIQVISGGPCRVGAAGVTATTGFKLDIGAGLGLSTPNVPTNAIFAIRDGGTDAVVFVQEVTG